MLQVNHLKKSFGDQDVLRDVSFEVNAGQRIGLVGANGVGKSTLLQLILGNTDGDGGEVRLMPHTTVALLPQDACCSSDTTLFGEMLTVFENVLANERQQRALERQINGLRPDDPCLQTLVQSHSALQDEFERLGGYEIETQIGIVLHGLGFQQDDYDKVCSHFSGGWQMRISLAKLLLQSPDLLLLDEPTNHLDLAAVEWLEHYLRDYRGALIVVSHDRYFLDRVTDRTLELEDGVIHNWPGNYSDYVRAKKLAIEQQNSAYERQRAYLRKQEAFVERFRASATRSTQAKSREKTLEKMERLDKPRSHRAIHFRFPRCQPSGLEVLTMLGVAKSFDGRPVFVDCDLTIQRGDRIALIGENGTGKTTLLRLMAKHDHPDRGTIKTGHNVRTSYYTQNQADSLNEQMTVLDEIYQAAPPDWTIGDVRDLLGGFLFSGDAVLKRIEVLSGGERSRVALGKMLLRPANLLLLDEPTNHLDIQAREVLEEALRQYEGTVVVVSHDRYFISRIANRIVELADASVKIYDGDYAYFREAKAKAAALQAEQAHDSKKEKERKAPTRAPRTRQTSSVKLLAALEEEIAATEERIRRIEQELTDPSLYIDGARARDTVAEYDATKASLEQLNSRWEELALAIEAERQV